MVYVADHVTWALAGRQKICFIIPKDVKTIVDKDLKLKI